MEAFWDWIRMVGKDLIYFMSEKQFASIGSRRLRTLDADNLGLTKGYKTKVLGRI